MLKSLAKIISLCEIFHFEGETETERDTERESF